QKEIEAGDKVIVGVNRFQSDETVQSNLLSIDEAIRHKQVERLASIRRRRDAGAWSAGLRAVRSAATEGRNIMPALIEAVESQASVGEIADVLRSVWGEYGGS
ncbi:MAG TPA: methylmalonyl-CoA mutase, partial [Bacteroidetes bacterium]|nr:methylmalonyl-CoA mutase [Bacteroidota bacterium]